jgi:hypothetical protein
MCGEKWIQVDEVGAVKNRRRILGILEFGVVAKRLAVRVKQTPEFCSSG